MVYIYVWSLYIFYLPYHHFKALENNVGQVM